MEAIREVEGTEPWKSAAQFLLDKYGYELRRWRDDIGGKAFTHESNPDQIEAPRPRSAKSFAVFAHEVGHLQLHANNGSHPRWAEEIEAWDFALDCFTIFKLPGKNKIMAWVQPYIEYALYKSIRRGGDPFSQLHRYPRWNRRIKT